MGTPEGPKPSATVRMDSDGSCSRSAVAHTVVSVGPYSLTKSTLRQGVHVLGNELCGAGFACHNDDIKITQICNSSAQQGAGTRSGP